MTNCLGLQYITFLKSIFGSPKGSFPMFFKMEARPESRAPCDSSGMARLSIFLPGSGTLMPAVQIWPCCHTAPSDGANGASESQWYLALGTHSH